MIIAVAAFLVLFPAPAFLMLDTGNTALVVLVIVIGFVFAAYGTVGSQAAAFAELAGSRYRYAAVALAREFSAVLGGGIAPLVSGVLVQLFAGWIGVVVYMTAIMLITLVTAIRMPETRGRDLRLAAESTGPGLVEVRDQLVTRAFAEVRAPIVLARRQMISAWKAIITAIITRISPNPPSSLDVQEVADGADGELGRDEAEEQADGQRSALGNRPGRPGPTAGSSGRGPGRRAR